MKIDLTVLDRNHKDPLHKQLASVIREAIKAGHYRPGERIEPERQFMRVGRLSNNTVTHAFNHLAAEGFVVRRVGSGTFVAREVAQPEVELKSVGIFQYGCWHESFQRMLQGAQEECRQHGVVPTPLIPEQYKEGGADRLERDLAHSNVGGIVACPTMLMIEEYHRALIREMARRVPVVLMDVYLREVMCDAVMTDNEEAAFQLGRHLIDLGHRNIAFVTHSIRYPYTSSIHERIAGMKRALRSGYIEPQEDLVVGFRHTLGSLPDHEVFVRQAVCSLLDRPRTHRPTAVMCVNDAFAECVLHSLHERHVAVPEEMSVTGFDDVLMARHLEPPLTTVAQPLERIGRHAVRLLIRRMREPAAPPVRQYLDGTLVFRESTGRPPASDRQQRAGQQATASV